MKIFFTPKQNIAFGFTSEVGISPAHILPQRVVTIYFYKWYWVIIKEQDPYEKEMADRGRRYFRKQRMWEYVEGAVILLLFIGLVCVTLCL